MNCFCDVIIPIYNAYEATKNCIDSVIKNTNLSEERLVLINDRSTDIRIHEHINKIKFENPELNIVVIENTVNKGFVGTVNVGMRYSNNDVLLLNSDTIVGKNWLEKIKNCAYSQPKVGTVTAMSNNATLASVPLGLSYNDIPSDITIDEYNDILTECAYRDYPELPTAHGFCMYIKREVLDTIGLFDEDNFGKGYGEENDFSYRCMDYGYKNLLCDDVIVYHLESQSFSKERDKVLDAHLKILEKKYSDYYNATTHWCNTFPIKYICKNIDYNLKLRKKKNILILIHEWDNVIGGTTIHVKDIISSLKEFYNFHVLFPMGGNYTVESHFGNEVLRTAMPFAVHQTSRNNRYNSVYGEMVDYIVKAFAVDSVHIHHMYGHFFDIGDIAKKHNLNSIITLHDFYSLCPSVNLLYCNKEYCENLKDRDCKKCLVKTGHASNNIIPEWQKDWHNFLKKFNKVIVPSDDTKARLQNVFDDIEITTIEHGVDNTKTNNTPQIGDKLRVAFIGVICHHKGGKNIRSLINKCHDKNIEFHAFGRSDFEDLRENTSNYIFHGPYERKNLSKLLWENKINVICFLQIWPETYSYTVNEAVSAGIPVLSLDIGAGAERVKKNNLGWILPADADVGEILEKLTAIKNDPSDYNRAVKAVKEYVFKSTGEMALEYKAIYNNPKHGTVDCNALKFLIKEEDKLANCAVIDYETSTALNAILTSAKWRVISRIKIPKFISRPAKVIFRAVKRMIKGVA